MGKIFVVTEEFEGSDGIREFDILGAYDSMEKAKGVMQGLIEKDEYGLVKDNGIEVNEEFMFRTKYNDGMIEYQVVESKVK